MGWGDPFLLAGIGAFTGWPALPLIVFLASAQGVLVGFWLLKTDRINQEPAEEDSWTPPSSGVPFGHFWRWAPWNPAIFFPGEGFSVFHNLLILTQGL